MSTMRFVMWIFSAGTVLAGAADAIGQSYPYKPIRIVTSSVGGGNDLISRLIAQGISGPMGQPVIVENRPTAVVGPTVATATPDGYTALLGGGAVWLAPLTQKVSYDPVKDLAPLAIVGTTPYVLFVTPALPVKSVKELIAHAKAKPGELNNSVGAIGGTQHLAGELFKSMAGVQIVAVHYSSSSQELTDLASGRVQLSLTTPGSLMEQVKSGKLRALAVASAQPSAVAPGLPTVTATGLPGYEWGLSYAMLAPSKVPAPTIKKLNQEVVRFLKTTEAKERFLNIGLEATGSTPEELAAYITTDMARVGKLIKDAGIKTN